MGETEEMILRVSEGYMLAELAPNIQSGLIPPGKRTPLAEAQISSFRLCRVCSIMRHVWNAISYLHNRLKKVRSWTDIKWG